MYFFIFFTCTHIPLEENLLSILGLLKINQLYIHLIESRTVFFVASMINIIDIDVRKIIFHAKAWSRLPEARVCKAFSDMP